MSGLRPCGRGLCPCGAALSRHQATTPLRPEAYMALVEPGAWFCSSLGPRAGPIPPALLCVQCPRRSEGRGLGPDATRESGHSALSVDEPDLGPSAAGGADRPGAQIATRTRTQASRRPEDHPTAPGTRRPRSHRQPRQQPRPTDTPSTPPQQISTVLTSNKYRSRDEQVPFSRQISTVLAERRGGERRGVGWVRSLPGPGAPGRRRRCGRRTEPPRDRPPRS